MDEKYLTLVAEEAAEVIQVICKIQRFGADDYWVKEGCVNREALAMEVGDFLEVLDRLGLPADLIEQGRARKREKLKKYGPEVWTPEQTQALIREKG